MLGKRLIAALVILTFLAACVSDPARDDSGQAPQAAPQSSSAGAGPNGKAANDGGTAGPDADQQRHSDGCCGGDWGNIGNGDPRVLLAVLVVVVVVISAVAVYHLAAETIDSIRHHTHPAGKDAIEGGVYRDPQGLFFVAIPGEYPSQGPDGIEVRQTAEQGQDQVFFITARDQDPVYGVSVQALASPGDATMPLADLATQLHPPPASSDPHAKPLPPLVEEKVTLDGKPALFREYSQGADGKPPVYYLLYFVRDDRHSAVLSVTWPKDCPKCGTGPEADIRAMDPHLDQFVESFRFSGGQLVTAR